MGYRSRVIGLLLVVAMLCGCATSRRATRRATWQTAQITNCVATAAMDSMQYTIGCSLHVMRDSLIILSVRPMMNIEVGRIEITPKEVKAIDKINHQYTTVPLTKTMPVVPRIRWNDLQVFASGEKAQKGDKVTLTYLYKGHPVRLDMTYGDIVYDGPVPVRRLNVDKYKYVDTFLQ